MAQLKDTIVSGSLRATDTIYTTTAQFQILRAPTASNGTTYGPGSANNILKSNGTSVYWATLAASDIPTNISITGNAANVTGTVAVDHGGTGSISAPGARSNLGLGNAKIFYGVCSTAAATTAKVVECSDFTSTELKSGAAILVTFTETNSGDRTLLTMNVNSTGAKSIKKQYNASQPADINSAGEIQAGNTYLFVYNASFNSNAGAWVLMTSDYNNTYDISQVSSASGANRQMETAANGGLGSHRYTLEMMTLNQTWSAISAVSGSVAANQGTNVVKVASTANFLLNSPILYTSTDLYTAPGASNNLNGYTAAGFNLRYSIGTTTSNVNLTIQKPVYLVGKINADMITFKLDSTQWWTQDLPTTKDEKIYIFLGMAYSTSNIYLYTYHPIYYHNGTTIKVYNPGIYIKDETPLTNDSNEYVNVTEVSFAHIENAASCNAENVVINIEPEQDLHGYSNPWPAGGGKNLCVPLNSQEKQGLKLVTNNDGTSNLNGTFTGTSNTVIGESASFTLPAGEYIINGGINTTYRLQLYNVNASTTIKYVTNSDDVSFTLNSETLMTIRIYIAYSNTMPAANNLIFKPMIRLASVTDATFASYSNICPITGWTGAELTVNEDTIDISWESEAGTIYGGTLDVTSGVLTVDRAMVDLGTLTWYTQSLDRWASPTIPNIKSASDADEVPESISTNYICKSMRVLNADSTNIGYGIYNGLIYVRNGSTTITPTGTLVYAIATPIEYNIPTTSLPLFNGTNNIWIDCGKISFDYHTNIYPVVLDKSGNLSVQVPLELNKDIPKWRNNFSDTDKIWGLTNLITNPLNTAYSNKNIELIVRNDGITIWNNTDNNYVWDFDYKDIQYSTSTPTTRSYGGALKEGDIWFKPVS